MKQNLQHNRKFVESVFNKVYNKYDLMNDIMSLGVHRIWKKKLIYMINPSVNQTLIDVGCGTGDIGFLYSKATKNKSIITSVDPNKKMVEKGMVRLKKFKNIVWKVCPAEKLDVPDEMFDFYTISFGLRNTKSIKQTLNEAFRVLKKGGRFVCLEFSKIDNSNLDYLYKLYSKSIPIIGKYIVGEKGPYEYLIKSIDEFLNQDELIYAMQNQGFINCNYLNLNGGIVAIHSGWKL